MEELRRGAPSKEGEKRAGLHDKLQGEGEEVATLSLAEGAGIGEAHRPADDVEVGSVNLQALEGRAPLHPCHEGGVMTDPLGLVTVAAAAPPSSRKA